MFRSRGLIDRRLTRVRRRSGDTNPIENTGQSFKEPNRAQFRDSNNNRTVLNNNFDFIEPCDIDGVIDGKIDSLESMKIKNWRYHLTNNKF